MIRAYPALVDEGASVAIRLMATPADQARETPRGVRRLLMLAVPSPVPDHCATYREGTLRRASASARRSGRAAR